EKAVQVTHMLAIYERASRVIVWLGEQGPNTRLAAQYLQWMKIDEPTTAGLRDPRIHGIECYKRVAQLKNGIEDLCTRNWVRRIWVKQEIWAARDIVVLCGGHAITWDEYR